MKNLSMPDINRPMVKFLLNNRIGSTLGELDYLIDMLKTSLSTTDSGRTLDDEILDLRRQIAVVNNSLSFLLDDNSERNNKNEQ